MNDLANPYRPGEPVVDPAMLFGRQDAADWLERQIRNNSRAIVISAMPLIGKTSLIKHVGALQSLEAVNLVVSLSAISFELSLLQRNDERFSPELADRRAARRTINAVLELVVNQLLPQLSQYNLTLPLSDDPMQSPSILREMFAKTYEYLKRGEHLVMYVDDLHLLVSEDMSLVASFLTSMFPLLDECPQLHLVFTANQGELKRIRHPLLDGAPVFNLGPLAADASANMISLPVKNILRFDYGVTKRIAEVNSHHPYYLCLFCHTLLNRQVHDGWVNQRDFDAALAELLGSNIEPF